MRKHKKGLSLVEILIAMVILAITAAGLFSSFVAANRFIARSKRRLAAANLTRHVNEQLFEYVRADTWADSVSNLLTCPDTDGVAGHSNGDYPCDKTLTLRVPVDGEPLFGYNPTGNLHIDLVYDRVAYPVDPPAGCDLTCPRSVEITMQWDE
ncbi:MAG: prepilin-type N-terminal cleavage/methylation domain-containing protein [Candidatus Omnitrophota bacterium]